MESRSFSPVWFTNDQQLAALILAYRASSLPEKMLGRLRTSAGMTYLQGVVMPWARVPTVLLAQGELTLTDASLTFRPARFRAFGWTVRGPHQELTFDIPRREILSVALEEFRSPVMQHFDFRFVRLRTSRPFPTDEFLLCIGGRLSMPKVRRNTGLLHEALLTWT